MSNEGKRLSVESFAKAVSPPLLVKANGLSEALYSMSELGLWPDGNEVSDQQSILCWQLIERLRRERFPDDLRM